MNESGRRRNVLVFEFALFFSVSSTMAVQAQLYQQSFGSFPPMSGLQDWELINPQHHPVSGLEAGFCFSTFQHPPPPPPPPQPQNLLLQQQITPQGFGLDYSSGAGASSSSSTCNSFLPMALSQSLDAHLEMQRQELDCILQFQTERLRYAFHHQRKQQLAMLLRSVESKALRLMELKEEDMAQAMKKNMELEAHLRKAQLESESWQRVVREKEAMVMDLSSTLAQVREKLVSVSSSSSNINRGQEAESSCCGNSCDEGGDQEDNNKKLVCKSCNFRNSCVLFLPCRHLCSCKSCEAFIASCPVCKCVKEASLEVFLV